MYEVKLNKKIWEHFYKSHLPIKVYYKSRQSYYKLRRSVVQNITTSFFYDKLRQSSYKLRQVLQITTNLSQINTAVTNYDNYYKLRQNIVPFNLALCILKTNDSSPNSCLALSI